jgi:hypothetical protein
MIDTPKFLEDEDNRVTALIQKLTAVVNAHATLSMEEDKDKEIKHNYPREISSALVAMAAFDICGADGRPAEAIIGMKGWFFAAIELWITKVLDERAGNDAAMTEFALAILKSASINVGKPEPDVTKFDTCGPI